MKHYSQMELFERIKEEFWHQRQEVEMFTGVRVALYRSLSTDTRLKPDEYLDPRMMPCKLRKDGTVKIGGITIRPKWHWTQDYYNYVKRQILEQSR